MRIPKTRRHQPRLPDRSTRDPVLSCVPAEIAARLDMDAALCGVRPSYIVADVLAFYYALPDLSPFTIDAANVRARHGQPGADRPVRLRPPSSGAQNR